MQNRITSLYELITYLNRSSFCTSDAQIATFIFEHRDELYKKSLREISYESYFSQSNLTRFFQKNGNVNLQEFKLKTIEDKTRFSNIYSQMAAMSKNKNISEIVDDSNKRILECLEQIKKIPENEIVSTVRILSSYHRVIFFGSDLSMATLNSLQLAMINFGVNCYTLSDPAGQIDMIDKTTSDDLIVYVSLTGRWLSQSGIYPILKKMSESPCSTMLWTTNNTLLDTSKYNHVFYIGKTHDEYAYSLLMCLAPIIVNVYVKYNNLSNKNE